MDLSNANAIVTGGTAGIGLAIAQQLKARGANVVICGRNPERLEAAAKAIGVTGVVADVSREADVTTLFEKAIAEMGSVNVLINNAGTPGQFGPLVEMATENLQHVLDVNVTGLFLCGRAAARHFIANGTPGNIINIGSTASLRGFPNGSAYVASKFAVTGLTECWRAELRKHNIRVFQINPSEVQTDFIAGIAGFDTTPNETKLQPAEVAHLTVAMLEMRDAGFIPSASIWATNPQ